MNRSWIITRKELLHTRRDRLAALFTIILPIIFTVFLGLIIGQQKADTHIPLAVADQDATVASQQFVESLKASPLLKVELMTADRLDTAVEDQNVAAALLIPKGFADAEKATGSIPAATLTLINIETSSGAQTVSQAVQAVVADLNSTLLATRIAAGEVTDAKTVIGLTFALAAWS